MIIHELTTKLKLENLAPSDVGVIGNIWFEVENSFFPKRGRNDFAETIMALWTAELIEIYRSKNKWLKKHLMFMDGSFEVVLCNGSPPTVHFKHDAQTKYVYNISLSLFAQEIINCRRILLYTAAEAGWKPHISADLEYCNWLENLIQLNS